MDGTLIEAWASAEEFSAQRREERRSAGRSWQPDGELPRGEAVSNQTHESTTDPDAKLARKGKGKEAKLSYNGNLLMENRNGLIVNTEVFEANGTAERDAALVMLEQIPGTNRVTVGGDKGYDTSGFRGRVPESEGHAARGAKHEADPAGARSMRARRGTADMRSVRRRGSALKSASDG